ncbi:MAG: ABC transporter substrate-binding protein [Synergistaceae bacterium]|nr:ABC transporter substrate-binding protein [Synergistaceae bacterium]
MRKSFVASLVLCLALGACPLGAAEREVPETPLVRWNSGASGNVLLTIAEKMGYLEEVGITLQEVPATANANAMTLLSTGMVDVVSNAGTANPLQQIAAGVDLTIFGGHMMTGAMPIIARKGTQWNGVQDLVGKRFACNPSYFALTGAVMGLGYDEPLKALDWVVITNYNDALAAVVKGEVDYALQGTEQNFAIRNANADKVDIMCYMSDIMPAYSCCRMEATTEFVRNNPITIKLILKALLRAQSYYESNKDIAASLHASKIRAPREFVEAYMFDEHYRVSADPLLKSIIRAWGILDATGFLSEEAKRIDIRDHVDVSLYKAALDEAQAEYGHEAPGFYRRMQDFFVENDVL